VPINRSPLHLLRRAHHCAENIFQLELKATDLTPRQVAVLLAVLHSEGSSQTALVAGTGMDRSTVADIVGRLAEKGFLHRQRSRLDVRAYAVKLTEAGRAALISAEPAVHRVDRKLTAALPHGSADGFIDHLRAIINSLGGTPPESTRSSDAA
jgi:DNA-binding MarR family transcriptional regulator